MEHTQNEGHYFAAADIARYFIWNPIHPSLVGLEFEWRKTHRKNVEAQVVAFSSNKLLSSGRWACNMRISYLEVESFVGRAPKLTLRLATGHAAAPLTESGRGFSKSSRALKLAG